MSLGFIRQMQGIRPSKSSILLVSVIAWCRSLYPKLNPNLNLKVKHLFGLGNRMVQVSVYTSTDREREREAEREGERV